MASQQLGQLCSQEFSSAMAENGLQEMRGQTSLHSAVDVDYESDKQGMGMRREGNLGEESNALDHQIESVTNTANE